MINRTNRGKQFEDVIKKAFLSVPNVSVDRLHDQMTGFRMTSANISDFIVYKKPYEYYIECKSVHGASLPMSNITENQFHGLLEKSEIDGVFAGIMCWFIDKDVTYFMPIKQLAYDIGLTKKSINYKECWELGYIKIKGKKKRVFFEYDMEQFFKEMEGQ